jgi:hypothetical protein
LKIWPHVYASRSAPFAERANLEALTHVEKLLDADEHRRARQAESRYPTFDDPVFATRHFGTSCPSVETGALGAWAPPSMLAL